MKSLLFILLAGTTFAQNNLELDWVRGKTYPKESAKVGDTLTFNWDDDETHNVLIHPTKDCTTTGATMVGETPGAKHTFEEVGEITFACDVYSGGHCRSGQIVTYVVTDASAVDETQTSTEDAASPTKSPSTQSS